MALYNDWTAPYEYSFASTSLVIHSSDIVTILCLQKHQGYRCGVSKQVGIKNHTQASAVPHTNHTSSVPPYLQLLGMTNPVVHVVGPWSPLINNSRLSEPVVEILQLCLYSMQSKTVFPRWYMKTLKLKCAICSIFQLLLGWFPEKCQNIDLFV